MGWAYVQLGVVRIFNHHSRWRGGKDDLLMPKGVHWFAQARGLFTHRICLPFCKDCVGRSCHLSAANECDCECDRIDRKIPLWRITWPVVGQSLCRHFLFHQTCLTLDYQFDSMSEPGHRKLAAIGIASLVSTGRPEVLERLPTEIFNLWLDVFGEIKEVQSLREENTWGYSNILLQC